MNTVVITYTYDPAVRRLIAFADGKPRGGGFAGPDAEARYHALLMSGADITLTDMQSKSEHAFKVRKIRAIWIKLGVDQYRESIIEKYRVSSTADLTAEQLDELIAFWSAEANKAGSDRVRGMRSEIMVQLNRLGVYATSTDWSRVNAFLLDKRIAGKLLYQCSEEELVALRRKLYAILAQKQQTPANNLN